MQQYIKDARCYAVLNVFKSNISNPRVKFINERETNGRFDKLLELSSDVVFNMEKMPLGITRHYVHKMLQSAILSLVEFKPIMLLHFFLYVIKEYYNWSFASSKTRTFKIF